MVTARWVADRRRDWGEESPLFQARVLGEFPDQSEDTLIPLSSIEAAVARHAQLGSPAGTQERPQSGPLPVEMGVDLARFGTCETVAYVRRGPLLVHGVAWRGADLMQSAGRIAALIQRFEPAIAKIDVVGIGAGVVDRLREQGYRQVVGVNVGRPPRATEK